ncbi:uncharacterized protein EI90DRAFT_315782 [Cantharellus anzutake]|uniref:uncharacterized protein n=1 Tax=Cantharellus anzutake TaxID=1750568 RepID=UPI0019039A81|nr:uncharacterized protein EI90DRAFT_315782 [Cantharellus anzutake]KAF8335303.1 hypothetical protein EI90DRAFT_315782 [Cantharellus anzutake]
MSVASALDNQGTLAASFFWDKNQKGMGLDSVERFPSTLALQLAAFSAEYKSLLLRQIRERASLKRYQGSALEKEMNAWIIDPMRELTDIRSSRKDRFIIVLDGLDECGDPDTLGSLMKLVLLLDELPPTFAILVSCRPEPQVISAWARAEAQDRHPVIPCEDVDKIARDETFHTIHRMVEEGLQDCIRESPWKPSNMDLNFFTSACRGLPLIASIRIREVRIQTQSGSVLKSEFEYFLNLMDAPEDLNEEYLRIMRRAYMPYRSRIRSRVVKNYHEVLGMIIAVWRELGVYDISQLLGITEDEVYSTLKPIGSIVNIPSGNTKYINFYHGTAREFITGDPIGEEEDKVFFISDTEGHFLGPRLLRIVNDVIKRNEFGVPTKPPLGDEKKWQHSLSRARPNHIKYAFEHVFNHLDRSLLISQDPNELQREFGEFLARNLFSLFSTVHRTYFYRRSDWDQGDVSAK